MVGGMQNKESRKRRVNINWIIFKNPLMVFPRISGLK